MKIDKLKVKKLLQPQGHRSKNKSSLTDIKLNEPQKGLKFSNL